MKTIKEEKKSKDTKIIILENNSEYFQKLIRQNEAIIDELNIKLEEVLEDNITIQTEYEIYKQIMTEQLMRKEDELKEIKNDMFSKDLMIKKLKNDNENNRFIKSKKSKTRKSNNKKIINKINHSYDYSSDNNFSFSFIKENELFKQLPQNSNIKNGKSNKSNRKKVLIPLFSFLNCIKQSAKKIGIKFTQSNSLKKSEKYNSNSLRTPSKNKIKESMINQNYSSHFTSKKNNEDAYELKQINKFVIDTDNNGDNSYLNNEETTCDLSIFKKQNEDNSNFSICINNDFSSNFVSNEKGCNNKIIFSQKKNIDVEPFKNVFLKKLLKTKKLSSNMEKKLMNFKNQNGKKITTYGKLNPKKEKIGYKLK